MESGSDEDLTTTLRTIGAQGNVVAIIQLDKMAEKERYQSLLRNMDSDEDPLPH